MHHAPLATFAFDTTAPLGATEPIAAPSVAQQSPPAPKVEFTPLTPQPIALPKSGAGEVIWFWGPLQVASPAALAWLLRKEPTAQRLLVELSAGANFAVGDLLAFQQSQAVVSSHVRRMSIAPAAASLRKWLLWLEACRERSRLCVHAGHPDPVNARHLAQLADRVVVVSASDEPSLHQAYRQKRQLHAWGARQSECLWLGAA